MSTYIREHTSHTKPDDFYFTIKVKDEIKYNL